MPNRRDTQGIVAASGRIVAHLIGQKAAIQAAADAANGTLVFAGFRQLVRVDQLRSRID